MNKFVVRSGPLSGDRHDMAGAAPPSNVPANLSPYEFYVAETQRRYRTLIDAGIDDDMAFEIASWVAMEKAGAMTNADDYENSPNVYGVAE